MSSARKPHRWTRALPESGSTLLSFFSTHQALLDRLARDRAVRGRADLRGQRRVGERPLPQLEARLLPQDAADGVVDARHRHASGGDQRFQVGDELAVVDRHHHHVDAGVDRDLDVLLVVVATSCRWRPSR